MNLIFWNTNRKSHNQILHDLILEHNSDVILLTEYTGNIDELRNKLYTSDIKLSSRANMGGCRVKMLINSNYSVTSFSETDYYTIKNLKIGIFEVLLVAVHFSSNLFKTDNDIKGTAIDLIKKIEFTEKKVKHSNTVIMGDFNTNPFNNSIIDACSIHGIPTRREARKEVRRVLGVDYKMFYNPMWNLFGDKEGIPGTYYYNNSDQTNYYWNMFDQVVLRPSLIDRFRNDSLNIITCVGELSLLNRNRVPNKEISDHLPIVFSIDV